MREGKDSKSSLITVWNLREKGSTGGTGWCEEGSFEVLEIETSTYGF